MVLPFLLVSIKYRTDIQRKLKELESAETDTIFKQILLIYPQGFSTDLIKSKTLFIEKKEFIQNVCRHYYLPVCNEENKDLKGLDVFGLKNILTEHCKERKYDFLLSATMKASEVLQNHEIY